MKKDLDLYRELKALCKKCGANLAQAQKMIIMHHELKYLIPKSKLKKINVNLKGDSAKLVEKLSKTLKVSESAVLCTLMYEYIEKEQLSDKKI